MFLYSIKISYIKIIFHPIPFDNFIDTFDNFLISLNDYF